MSIKFGAVRREVVKEGKNVMASPFCTIGFVGFGFKKDDSIGDYKRPLERNNHDYMVVLEDNVFIGPGTNIDRGSWRDTVIGKGTQLDAGVHVAHNVVVGKHCLLVAGCVIGGSCNIGDRCFIGMNVSIREHTNIADGVTLGAGAVVVKDIDEPNTTWVGNPARRLQ